MVYSANRFWCCLFTRLHCKANIKKKKTRKSICFFYEPKAKLKKPRCMNKISLVRLVIENTSIQRMHQLIAYRITAAQWFCWVWFFFLFIFFFSSTCSHSHSHTAVFGINFFCVCCCYFTFALLIQSILSIYRWCVSMSKTCHWQSLSFISVKTFSIFFFHHFFPSHFRQFRLVASLLWLVRESFIR